MALTKYKSFGETCSVRQTSETDRGRLRLNVRVEARQQLAIGGSEIQLLQACLPQIAPLAQQRHAEFPTSQFEATNVNQAVHS